MKTLYLHIGTPKTGTTAIQKFCEDNQKLLQQQGYCYPILPYTYGHRPLRRNGSFLHERIYGDGIRQPEKEEQRFQEGLNTVIELFQQYDNLILSDEGIWRGCYEHRKTLWTELKKAGDTNNFKVKVIVYLRRQDSLIESWWNQLVKTTILSCKPWETYVTQMKSNNRFNFYKVLSLISTVLGKENIIVRRFDRNYFPDGFIQYDFLQAIGLAPTDKYNLSTDKANPKLLGNTQEIKRILNTLPNIGYQEDQFFFKAAVSFSELSGELYPNSMFSPDEARDFMETFRKDNRKIAEEYLHEKNSDLFDMTFKDLPKWKKDNPYMLDDIIRFIGASNIQLLERINQLKEENTALRKDIQAMRSDIQKLRSDTQKVTKHFQELQFKFRHPLRTICHKIVWTITHLRRKPKAQKDADIPTK